MILLLDDGTRIDLPRGVRITLTPRPEPGKKREATRVEANLLLDSMPYWRKRRPLPRP